MNEASALSPELEPAGQDTLPGLASLRPRFIQPPLVAEVKSEPIPGQLTFGPRQSSLEDVTPEPVQLALLDEPPIWEQGETSPPRNRPQGRLARRRQRKGITPGQTSLF